MQNHHEEFHALGKLLSHLIQQASPNRAAPYPGFAADAAKMEAKFADLGAILDECGPETLDGIEAKLLNPAILVHLLRTTPASGQPIWAGPVFHALQTGSDAQVARDIGWLEHLLAYGRNRRQSERA